MMKAILKFRDGSSLAFGLLTDTKFVNQFAVCAQMGFLQIHQQPLALANQRQQRLPAGVVLGVLLEVLRQLLDAVGKQGDLPFGRTRVLFRTAEFLENLFFFLFG